MRTWLLLTGLGVAFAALQDAAADPVYYTLKAGSYHCARAEPLENADEYLAQYQECARVDQNWWLIARPETVEPDVVRIDMGGRFGIRYARAANVVLEAAKPESNQDAN